MRSETRRDTKLFRTLTQSLLKDGIGVQFEVRGRSMFPAIKDGEVVRVEPTNNASQGDVLLLETEDGLRVHRVVEAGDRCITKGDSCLEADGTASPGAVIGRVSAVIGMSGRRSPHTMRSYLRKIPGIFRK